MLDSSGNPLIEGAEFQRAEQAVEQSRRSAATAGLRDAEYNAAVAQLAQLMEPETPPQPNANQNVPDSQLVELGNGNYEMRQATGEVFRGTLQQIVEQQANQHVHDKRWVRDIKKKYGVEASQQPANGQQPHVQPEQVQIPSSDIAEQFAKSVGFSDAAEMISDYQRTQSQLQEMQSQLEAANQFASQYQDEQVANAFIAATPSFPGDDHAVEVLKKIMDASDLDYSKVENLQLAHEFAVRRGFYRALTAEDIAVANGERSDQQQSSRRVPPQPPQGNAPGNDGNQDLWKMGQDELRRKVLEGGGFGRVLLDLEPGSRLGG
jgi:hypothetical protein